MQDVTFEVSLNNDGSRKATITTYGSKGATVSVREFYRKGAEMAPGKKGINLTPEQWSVLCAVSIIKETAVVALAELRNGWRG